jgi:YfiH family protein
VHGFFGRDGGVSHGPYASLNLSFNVGDDADAVKQNWARVRNALPGVHLITMGQVHGATVVRADEMTERIEGVDGVFTERAGIALGVMTADCVPILMIAPRERIAIAVHAGWRGTLAGIGAVAVDVIGRDMGLPPQSLQVALGPAIGQCCYEVDAEIGTQMEQRWGRLDEAWQAHGKKGHLDLRETNRRILMAQGVPAAAIDIVGPCTACQMTRYFSHRASNGRAGRQLSVVGWV